jgi:hypothetical protein
MNPLQAINRLKILTLIPLLGLLISTAAARGPEQLEQTLFPDGLQKEQYHAADEAIARSAIAAAIRGVSLGAMAASAETGLSRDVDVDGDGRLDIAIVEDNGIIIQAPKAANLLDISAGTRLTFNPPGVSLFDVDFASGVALDPFIGSALAMTDGGAGPPDDGYETVNLPFSFPYLGNSYGEIHIGSDGHITLDMPEAGYHERDAARHSGGPPRISPLFTDLSPGVCGGTVHADLRADRVVVTWKNVVHYERWITSGCEQGDSTLQAILYTSGEIEFIYGMLDTGLIGSPGGNRQAVVGLAAGNFSEPFTSVNITTDFPLTDVELGTVFEEFSQAVTEPTMNFISVLNRFYQDHPDQYDTVVIHSTVAGQCCFSSGITNKTMGIGLGHFDFSSLVGSDGELETFLSEGNIDRFTSTREEDLVNPALRKFEVTMNPGFVDYVRRAPLNPGSSNFFERYLGFVDITGDGYNNGYSHHIRSQRFSSVHGRNTGSEISEMSLLAQETGHRWMFFAEMWHPDPARRDSSYRDLIGRGQAHYSNFFNGRVPATQFPDGRPRTESQDSNAIIHLDVNSAQEIIDRDRPERVFVDPDGKLAWTLSRCRANGQDAFLTEPDSLQDGWNELDQYLMGVRLASEVSPFWYVDDASTPGSYQPLDSLVATLNAYRLLRARDDLAFCGERIDLTVADLSQVGIAYSIPRLGLREPLIGDEGDEFDPVNAALNPSAVTQVLNLDEYPIHNDSTCNEAPGTSGRTEAECVDVKTQAWVLVIRKGEKIRMSQLEALNLVRKTWTTYANGPATGGLGARGRQGDVDYIPKFDTHLDPVIH